MGRGTRQPKRDRPQLSIRDTNARRVSAQNRRCWEFSLVRPTNASNVQVDDRASGSIHAGHVLVSSRGETLGFVPTDAAREMIAAVGKTGASLLGRVRSAEGGLARTVELCLS